jgi:hypothetical protein
VRSGQPLATEVPTWRRLSSALAEDAVYNGIHPYLGETDTQSRLEWISTLDKLEALKPNAVVAGHKVPENDDDPRIVAEAGNTFAILIA